MRQGLFNDILLLMKRYLFLILIFLMPFTYAAEETVAELGPEFWFTPRHGDVIAAHEGVRAAVKKLIAEPEAYLVVRYPDTESGELWGQELQAWLVSLGLVMDRMELQSAPERLESVALVVISPDVETEELSLIEDTDVGGVETDMMAETDKLPQTSADEHQTESSQQQVVEEAVEVQVETELE